MFFIVFILPYANCGKNTKNKIGMEVNGLYYLKAVIEVKTVTVVFWFTVLCCPVLDANISEE
jgi:hypothetical protein